jgi:hypothetical protein
MRILTRILPLALGVTALTPVLGQTTTAHKADGTADEWPSGSLQADTVNHILFGSAVEAGKLHVVIEFRDPMLQGKALRAGMELGFDTEHRGKPVASIHFPEPAEGGQGMAGGPPRGDVEAMRLMLMLQVKTYSLRKFPRGNGAYTLGNPNDAGVELGIDYNDRRQLVYEASIPLESLHARKAEGPVPDSLDLLITLKGIEMQGFGGGGMAPGGGGGGFSGGRGGGGRGRSGGFGGPPSGRSGGNMQGGGYDPARRDEMMRKMQETARIPRKVSLKS